MSHDIIVASNLGKQYRLGAAQAKYMTFRDSLSSAAAAPWRKVRDLLRGERAARKERELVWAVRDISLRVQQGEVLGLIGRNGAGKSTLLKILSRITEPTCGRAEIRGRVGSLLEVGTGFHPELTGRENIFLNGGILGMRRSEIARQFDDIVAFAEVERFIDTPVKHYSSGMYLRLAFAVAAHLDPEVLLIDEVLAVGDVAFQRKCMGKMGQVARQGRTIIFVSHNLAAVQNLCTSAALLDHGTVTAIGPPEEVIQQYMASSSPQNSASLEDRTDRTGSGRLRITGLQVYSDDACGPEAIRAGAPVEFVLSYRAETPQNLNNVCFDLVIQDAFGQALCNLSSWFTNENFDSLSQDGSVSCRLESLPFVPDTYRVDVACNINGETSDWIQDAMRMTLIPADFYETGRIPRRKAHGLCLVKYSWRNTLDAEASSQMCLKTA